MEKKLQHFILVDDALRQVDTTLSYDKEQALQEFSRKGWSCGGILTYQEYQDMLRNESELNSLENQSLEC